jgi:hypothetical protein
MFVAGKNLFGDSPAFEPKTLDGVASMGPSSNLYVQNPARLDKNRVGEIFPKD